MAVLETATVVEVMESLSQPQAYLTTIVVEVMETAEGAHKGYIAGPIIPSGGII